MPDSGRLGTTSVALPVRHDSIPKGRVMLPTVRQVGGDPWQQAEEEADAARAAAG